MTRTPSIVATVRAELLALDASPRALRQFGLAVGGVFLAIAAVVFWRRGWEPSAWVWGLGGVGGVLVGLGALAPVVLRPVHRVWMGLAFALGFVMTRVLLTLAFILAVLPIGLVLRALGKDPLRKRPDADAPTYWILRDDGGPDRQRLERLF